MQGCPQCWAWTLPLHLNGQRGAFGGVIAMRYEQWLLYYWHVVMHQRGNWPGELTPIQ